MTNLPLTGIKAIDYTGVQAGPACTQMLTWFGADGLKVERTTGGDVTRHQLRVIPDVDALYFTMLNSNKRSLAINTKTPDGKEVMEKLIRDADKTKYEAVGILRKFEVPCAPVLSMKEIANDPALRASRSIVENEHKERGNYLTVGCPVKFSEFTPAITGSPLLGEHTDDVLTELGHDSDAIAKMHADHIV